MDSSWLTSLVARSISSDGHTISSKIERIEKRKKKKMRRDDRKRVGSFSRSSPAQLNNIPRCNREYLKNQNQKRLRKISRKMNKAVQRLCDRADPDRKGWTLQPFIDPGVQSKGKAVSHQQLTLENIQPVKSCYGGQGLARPSLLVSLRDPSFVPKFEEEFSEHIPGFFGKQRTNAMKKQLDGKMLWRRLQNEKKRNVQENKDRDISGKKTKQMTPEEKLEAILRTGSLL